MDKKDSSPRRQIYLKKVLRSNYCKAVFVIIFILSYFLVPEDVFVGYYILLAVAFMLSISLSLTCIIRNIKERVKLSRTYETSSISVIAAGIGLAALQVCGVGAPVCGASVGLGILSAIFPGVFVNFLQSYAVWIIVISIVLQLIALYEMNCFVRVSGA